MGVLEGKIKFEGSVGEEKKCSFDVDNMPGGDVPEIPEEDGVYALSVNEDTGNKDWEDYTEALDFADAASADFPFEEQGTYLVHVGANKQVTYVKLPDLPTVANRYALKVDQSGALSWDALDEF